MAGEYEGYVQYASDERISLQCFEGRCSECPDMDDHEAEAGAGGPLDGYNCEHSCADDDAQKVLFTITRGELAHAMRRAVTPQDERRFVERMKGPEIASVIDDAAYDLSVNS
jgi:hypothetical protein